VNPDTFTARSINSLLPTAAPSSPHCRGRRAPSRAAPVDRALVGTRLLQRLPGRLSEDVDLISTHRFLRMSTIAKLNDAFRRMGVAGTVFVTPGIRALPFSAQAQILNRVVNYDAFTESNDPWGEHDFGSFGFGKETIFWKIDYYDRVLRYHSPDPADPGVTRRVLVVMLAEEY
jgi:hypothetical protein